MRVNSKVFKQPIDYFYRQKETDKDMNGNVINAIGAATIYIRRGKTPQEVKHLLKQANLSYRTEIIKCTLIELAEKAAISGEDARNFLAEYQKLEAE